MGPALHLPFPRSPLDRACGVLPEDERSSSLSEAPSSGVIRPPATCHLSPTESFAHTCVTAGLGFPEAAPAACSVYTRAGVSGNCWPRRAQGWQPIRTKAQTSESCVSQSTSFLNVSRYRKLDLCLWAEPPQPCLRSSCVTQAEKGGSRLMALIGSFAATWPWQAHEYLVLLCPEFPLDLEGKHRHHMKPR